jgi:hypothetical protein
MNSNVNSRYVESVTSIDGTSATVSTRAAVYPVRFSTYLSRERDSFESIATWSLGSPERWWEIADINSHVRYPNYIPPGTSIRIPSL